MTSLKFLFDEAMKKQRSEQRCAVNINRRSSNKTGFKWLCRVDRLKSYHWVYHRRINGEYVSVYGADLFRLFDKVVERGYDWIVLDEERARRTVESEGLDWSEFQKYTGIK